MNSLSPLLSQLAISSWLYGHLIVVVLSLVGVLLSTAIIWQLVRTRPPKGILKPVIQPALPPRPPENALILGLAKTRTGLMAKVAQLLGRKQFDAAFVEELEELLFTADIGAKTSLLLLERVKERLSQTQLLDSDLVMKALKEESRRLLDVPMRPLDFSSHHPFVILVVGVNGAGKTTTIGKLAATYHGEGRKVVLAAGDTFRAAAVKQLEVWGQRTNSPVIQGKEGADPSAVIFDALKQAQTQGADVLIADTAGRLHVKTELMEELRKVRRVITKAEPSAPHETWLVLDSTNGQNAIAQASVFKEAIDISGIILTKLDGTAKGGVILGIVNELQIPVRYVGVGEKVEDLRPFDKDAFIEALYGNS